jgi:hypothetical protein
VRRPLSSKPDTCTEGVDVNAAGISVKVTRITLGGLTDLPCATGIERFRDGWSEVSRSHSSRTDQPMKGGT